MNRAAMASSWMVVIMLATLACGRGRSAPEPTSGDAPKNGGSQLTPTPTDTHKFTQHTVDELGLSFDLLEGISVSKGAAGGLHYVIQTHGARRT